MTDYTSNPFFQSPYIAQAGNNLIKAFNDDGHIALNKAHAGYYNAERDKVAGETAGREGAATAIQGQDFSGPISQQFWAQLGANAVRSGQDPKQIANAVQFMRSNSNASPGDIAAAIVGAGGRLGTNEGVTLEDRNTVAKKAEDAAFNRTKYSADSSAGASRANNADTLAFHERHAFDNPIQVAPEHAVYPKTNDQGVSVDPRLRGVVPGSMPVPRMVTAFDTNSPTKESRQEDRVGTPIPVKSDRLITQFDATSPTGGVRAVDAPGVIPAAKEEKPLTLTPGAAADMKFNVLQGIPGALSPDGKSVDPDFFKQNGDKIQAAETAMADTYKRTRDATAAEKAFKDILSVKPGQSFEKGGIFGHWGGAGLFDKNGRVDPSAAPAAPPAPAGTAQAAPTISSNFAPPAAAAAPAAGPAAAALDEARAAIAKGAPLAAVIQRLKQNGIDPSALNAPQNANDGAR